MAKREDSPSDDAKAKFREALEQKKLRGFRSEKKSQKESSQSPHQGPSGGKRMFRRKSGNG